MKIEDLSFCLEITKDSEITEDSSSVNGGRSLSDIYLSRYFADETYELSNYWVSMITVC